MKCIFPAFALLLAIAPLARAADDGDTPQTLAKKLNARITIDAPLEKVPLRDALAMFGDKFDLTILVDPLLSDLQGGGPGAVADLEPILETPVSLPKVKKVKLGTALRNVLDQVGAAYLIESDHLKVTARAAADWQSGTVTPDPNGDNVVYSADVMQRIKPLTQRAVVTFDFKGLPLSEALDDLAESTGANVVLSATGEPGKTPITARLRNTPLNVAVRILAEQADLAVVEKANVLMVTTRDKAKAWEAREKAAADAKALPLGFMNGVGPFPPQQPAAELGLNAQDRELFERIEKHLLKSAETPKAAPKEEKK